MPTYDYECDACDHKFELYQSISAPVETVCPECKKKKLRRLIGTGGAIVFKGSGFTRPTIEANPTKNQRQPTPSRLKARVRNRQEGIPKLRIAKEKRLLANHPPNPRIVATPSPPSSESRAKKGKP